VAPHWNAARRELRFHGKVVKRFCVPAINQVRVLSCFQELDWIESIDDPLPPVGDTDPKQRLRATIKSLNSGHKVRLIRFHLNGTGTQIYWEAATEGRKGYTAR
jgi:hypothetical protein